MSDTDYASRFAVGDDVYMLTDDGGVRCRVRCRVVSVGAARLTVERLDNGKRSTRAYTVTRTERSFSMLHGPRRYVDEVFHKLTDRDKWLEGRPQPVVGISAYSSVVEIQPITIRDHLDEVIAYLTAYSEWRRKEPQP